MFSARSRKWTYGNKLTAALSKKRIYYLDSLDRALQRWPKGQIPLPPGFAQPQSQESFLYFLMVGGKKSKEEELMTHENCRQFIFHCASIRCCGSLEASFAWTWLSHREFWGDADIQSVAGGPCPSLLMFTVVAGHHQLDGHEFEQALGVGDG